MPEGAEIVAGFETGFSYANDDIAFASEHRDTRQPAACRGPTAHVGGEAVFLMADHVESPASACGETLLYGG